jgi:hypothetical protein
MNDLELLKAPFQITWLTRFYANRSISSGKGHQDDIFSSNASAGTVTICQTAHVRPLQLDPLDGQQPRLEGSITPGAFLSIPRRASSKFLPPYTASDSTSDPLADGISDNS